MQTDKDAAPFQWDEAEAGWQTRPVDVAISLPQPETDFEKLAKTCGRVFACTCGTGGGFLAAHAGCIASPLIAFATASAGSSLPFISAAASVGLTSVGVGGWALVRWKRAGNLEKGLTLTSAFAGVAMGLAINFADVGHQQKMQSALDWSITQSKEVRQDFWVNAQMQGVSLIDYIMQICGLLTGGNEDNHDSAPVPKQ
jgi:hypothetical protein